MYKVDKDWTWEKYFKQVGIYQGRWWWHDLYDIITKLKRKR